MAFLSLLACLVLGTASASPAAARSSHDLQASYDVAVHLDWDSRWVHVKTTIDVTNTSGGPVGRIHLNTVAARLGSMRQLKTKVDGVDVDCRVSGQTITVLLGTPLAPDASATLRVAYRARLRNSNIGRNYLWAKLDGVAHLYRFIPWISRRIPFGAQAHGEPFLTPVSPSVRVTASSDRKLVWATTGRRVGRSGTTSTFVAEDVRDFIMTASPLYKTVRGSSLDGQTRIIAHTRTIDGRRLIRLARQELDRYERKTGIDYPYPTYRIAELGGGLAMEAPALIWIPASRSPADHPFLVSHETAHQWFYGIVGNDQSTDAFADEALADYFSRRAHLSIRASRCTIDRLDRDIRRYSSPCYFEVIYVQGAGFLDGLRRDFGRAAFDRAIKTYARDHRLGVGSNVKLLEAFRAEMGDRVVKRFHRRFPSLYGRSGLRPKAMAEVAAAPRPVASVPPPSPSPTLPAMLDQGAAAG